MDIIESLVMLLSQPLIQALFIIIEKMLPLPLLMITPLFFILYIFDLLTSEMCQLMCQQYVNRHLFTILRKNIPTKYYKRKRLS